MVLSPKELRDLTRRGGLVEGCVLETDRERLEAVANVSHRERRHRARIDAAREEDPQRHVAHQVPAHGKV